MTDHDRFDDPLDPPVDPRVRAALGAIGAQLAQAPDEVTARRHLRAITMASRSGPVTVVRRSVGTGLIAAGVAAVLAIGGLLPAPAQEVAADLASRIGVQLPRPSSALTPAVPTRPDDGSTTEAGEPGGTARPAPAPTTPTPAEPDPPHVPPAEDLPGPPENLPVPPEDRLQPPEDRPGRPTDRPGQSADRPGPAEDRPGPAARPAPPSPRAQAPAKPAPPRARPTPPPASQRDRDAAGPGAGRDPAEVGPPVAGEPGAPRPDLPERSVPADPPGPTDPPAPPTVGDGSGDPADELASALGARDQDLAPPS